MDRQLSNDLIIAGNQRITEREYWLKKFSGDFQRGSIPYDFPWKSQGVVERETAVFTLPQDLAFSCLKLANQSVHNLYLVLCSGVVLLTSKYLSSADLVLGSPVVKQEHDGELLNTIIPLRLMPQSSMNFNQLLMHLKEVYLEGIAHQNYPIELLAAHLGLSGQSTAFPLFDLVVLLKELHIEQFYQHAGPNLLFAFTHTGDTIGVEVTYNPALYERPTIERLFQQYTYLFRQAFEHRSERVIQDLEVVSAESLCDLVERAHGPAIAFPEDATLVQLFEEIVERFPRRVALQLGEACLTYAELNSRANRLAQTLRARISQPEEIIGIYMERSLEMIVAMLAILKAGAAYLPLDPSYPVARTSYMLEDSQARIICTQTRLVGNLPGAQDLVLLDDDEYDRGPEWNREILHTSRNLAYVIYTSGTTGKPKGVMIEQRQVVRLLKNDAFPFQFHENDTWTLFHSFCFDFSVWEIYGALLSGARLLIVPQEMTLDPSAYLGLLKKERVTVLNQTPGVFFRLIEEERRSDTHKLALRYVIFGGEALKPGKLESWRQIYPDTALINMYGITETTVHVTYKSITASEIEADISNIGVPIPTTSVYILDAHLKPVPVGMVGEIFVGGEGVARGYLKRPDLTQERFLPNPFRQHERVYRTGDLGRWRNNGEIEYIGRADQQVKIRGFRIEVGEIEAQILQFRGITNTIVLPVEDAEGETALCAYIVSHKSENGSVSIADLKAHLTQLLPTHMLPAFLVMLDELPLTEQGKLNRAALPDPRQFVERETAYVAPRTRLEHRMVQTWAEVLQIPQREIGIRDSFFALGGNSFAVLTLNNRLQEILPKPLSVISHFQYPTILSLIEYVGALHEDGHQSEQDDEDEDAREMYAGEEEEAMDIYAVMEGLSQLAEEPAR